MEFSSIFAIDQLASMVVKNDRTGRQSGHSKLPWELMERQIQYTAHSNYTQAAGAECPRSKMIKLYNH